MIGDIQSTQLRLLILSIVGHTTCPHYTTGHIRRQQYEQVADVASL